MRLPTHRRDEIREPARVAPREAARPDAVRPYRAIGYPVLPAVYIAMSGWICVVLLRYKPQYTWPGLILVLLGVPVYLVWKRFGTAEHTIGG